MSWSVAVELFGEDAVRTALGEPNPDPVTAELAREVALRADPPGVFRAWALSQPWARFCAIVAIVSGQVRSEVLRGGDA